MNKDMQFACGKCGTSWKSSDAATLAKTTDEMDENFVDYRDGYNCPKCGSRDISGTDL